MVTCTLPPPNQDAIQHQISCISLNSTVKLSKSTLGFDSENRLFKSQRLQAALAFCHKNVESWYREVRIAPDFQQEEHCAECRKLAGTCDAACPKTQEPDKQIITKEVLEKFPKPKKWYKHFKLLGKGEDGAQLGDPLDGLDKSKSIDRYKDMSKLIEEKFGRKSYNPVKKSASFMFSTKRIDLDDGRRGNPALLKCQSLDTQLYSIAENQRASQERGSLRSYDFQMCILDEKEDEIVPLQAGAQPEEDQAGLDPDAAQGRPRPRPLLPHRAALQRVPRQNQSTKSQVRWQKRAVEREAPAEGVRAAEGDQVGGGPGAPPGQRRRFRQRRGYTVQSRGDEVCQRPNGRKNSDENIYAEICESGPCCDNNSKLCERTKKETEYCYVKLGSNGDSVTQSDSDEAIYNTLR
jgi:hypothetical protein